MTIHTENTKLFELKNGDVNIDEYNSDLEIISNYGDILKNKTKEKLGYYCFNYALNNRKIKYMEDAVDILFEEYLNIKKLKKMKKRDIILFYDDFETLHLAKVIKTNGTIQGTTIRAKFGRLGIYEHLLNNTPTCYGHKFIIFRGKNKK